VAESREVASLARKLSREWSALEEGAPRTRAAARALDTLEAGLAAEIIGMLLARTGGSDAKALAAIVAVGRALLDDKAGLSYPSRAAIYAEASARGMEEVTSLFLSPAPREQPERMRADAHLAHLTLGHKKAMARGKSDPDLLARLAAEGDPRVVRELLLNPRMTEPLVVRIAARRPCRAETLRCLYGSRRWRTRPEVLRALVKNPYLEPEIGLKIVPLLAIADLDEVAGDGTLHPTLRALARRLRSDRPPQED
jgi:hypothetical protein